MMAENKMNKKISFALLILLVFIGLSHSSEAVLKIIYNKAHSSGESFTIDEIPFNLVNEDKNTRVILTTDNPITGQNYFFIKNNSCNIISNIQVCYNGTTGTVKDKTLKYKITAFPFKPEILIKRTTKTTPYLGLKYKLNLTINNTGSAQATNFSYYEEYPENVIISSCNVCTIDKNTVKYEQSSLANKQGLRMSYDIIFNSETPRTYIGTATFYNGRKNVEQFSDKMEIKPKNIVEINMTFNKTQVTSGQNVKLRITIENKISESLKLKNITLVVPNGMIITETGFKEKSGNYVLSDVTLGVNSSMEITTLMESEARGSYDVKLNVQAELDKYGMKNNFNLEKSKTLVVKMSDLQLANTIKDSEKFQSGQTKIYKMTIINHNHVRLRNVNITLRTNITNISNSFFFPIIEETSSKELFLRNITLPIVSTITSYPINTRINYSTDFGESFQKEYKVTATVEPLGDLNIKRVISTVTLEPLQTSVIEVNIESKKKTIAKNVEIFEKIPKSFEVIGTNYKVLDIHGSQTINIYTYTIKAPILTEKRSFTINTSAFYYENFTKKERNFTLSNTVTVQPKKLDIKITRRISDFSTSELYSGRILKLDYDIENADTEIIKDLMIQIPVMQNFDSIGKRKWYVKSLSPGEKIRLEDIESIRAKYNRTLSITPAVMYYKDSEGYSFNASDSASSKLFAFGTLLGPAFILNKSILKAQELEKGNNVTVKLTIKNIGKDQGNIKIEDLGKAWNFIGIAPGKDIDFNYSYIEDRTGKFTLSKAYGNYSSDFSYLTASNVVAAEMYYIKKVQAQVNITVNETVQEKKEEPEQVEEKKKGFVDKVKSFFLKILYWKLG